ncbi:MAG TPA: M14 family zinc carboxypeptidase [archaeon]|nr:M14 family zinc carboxypeptidase [archaeon]
MRLSQGLSAALLFFTAIQSMSAAPPEKIPRLRWHLLEISPQNNETLRTLIEQGIEILELTPQGVIRVLSTDQELGWFEEQGFKPNLLIEDYGRALAERNRREALLAAQDEFACGSMGGYFSPEEVAAFVDSLIAGDPHGIITARFEIGRSHWDTPIWMVKVSDNPEIDEDEPEVFYNSLIHSREGMSLMTLLYFLRFIVENYGKADSVTWLVDNRELYFLPVVNPDGYEINWQQYRDSGKFGFWRKNARDNEYFGIKGEVDDSDGVDLNRNFSYQWGYDEWGSSVYPNRESYRGPEPFSEPETVAIRDFVRGCSLVTAVNFHSYGPVLINPFNYIDQLTPDSLLYMRLGELLTAENGYKVGNVARTLGSTYRANGEFTDWEYADTLEGKGKIIAWSCEIGTKDDNFWPLPGSIKRLAEENLPLNFNLARIAGFWPGLDSLAVVFGPDDSSMVSVAAGVSNIGLSASRGEVSLSLESANPGLTLVFPAVLLGNLEAASGTIFPADSLRVAFGDSCFRADAELAIYDGDERIRTFRISLERPQPPVSYDINRDGRVNIFDLLALLKALGSGVPQGEQAASYDLNRDNAVNILDLIALLKVL